MEEHDKTSKLIMWSKINELISIGLNYSQIARQLQMHRDTVKHYSKMTVEEFMNSMSYNREYAHKLDIYEEYVVDLLERYPFVSAALVHDRLREHYPDMIKVSDKTVYNFVKRLRLTHDIPKRDEPLPRQMSKLPETDYGEYGQIDFGEGYLPRRDGSRVKVYFMVLVLSRSRYKYVYFSKRPFTSESAIYAHELAFSYFGGKPKKLVYDQDRVFIKDENLGDYKLTARFAAFCNSEKIEVVFCRKSDPQSKGKVENAVKYVKHNFMPGREYTDIDTLNEEALEWLERTANGTEHRGIRQIPSELFKVEREWLRPYTGTPTPAEDRMELRAVRQDNTIMYGANFYTLPQGTYRGRGSEVYVEEKDSILHVYNKDSGKTICEHTIWTGCGKTVYNQNHMRSTEQSLDEYCSGIITALPEVKSLSEWKEGLISQKGSRYLRDNFRIIDRDAWKYSGTTLEEACHKCVELKVFNAHQMLEVAESLRILRKEPLRQRPVDMSEFKNHLKPEEIKVEKSNISTYQEILDNAI